MFAALNSFLTRAVSGYFLNKSLRFRSSASAYLNRTFGTPTNNKKWTWSGWVKRGALGASETIFSSFQNGSNYFDFRFNTSDQLFVQNRVGAVNLLATNTTAVYRDPSAWYHIMFVFDSDNATAANRNLLYVNGVSVAWLANSGSSDASNFNASGYEHDISGSQTAGLWALFDGEQAEVNFVDGQALAPTSFGAYSIYNQWLPIRYAGTYGTNGFYLPFSTGTDTSSVSVNYLVVAGGGGGGRGYGGGGGAGGYRTGTLSVSPSTPYTVTVGAGGAGSTNNADRGTNGSNSVFDSITSTGGGGAGSVSNNDGGNGGSGGGVGDGRSSNTAGSGNTPTTSPSQGNNGGTGAASNGGGGQGGGGGGAGAVGGNATSSVAGNGGAGVASSISGSSVTYAGGGGGGPSQLGSNTAGTGGAGGGGNGQLNSTGSAGTANLGGGGGGGGAGNTIYSGGSGGSGVVIISYAGAQKFYGGTVTSSGGNTIHTFTASGFLTSVFNDASGNGNNWTPNNISLTAGSTYDSLTDVPTLTSETVANYAVLNAVNPKGNSTVSNGNLTEVITTVTGAGRGTTIAVTSGKFYVEATATGGGAMVTVVGITSPSASTYQLYLAGVGYYSNSGNKYISGVASAYGTAWSTAGTYVIGMALDVGAGTIQFYLNNVAQGNITLPTMPSDGWIFVGDWESSAGSVTYNWNYGQQPFTYTAPSGFLPLNTFNI